MCRSYVIISKNLSLQMHYHKILQENSLKSYNADFQQSGRTGLLDSIKIMVLQCFLSSQSDNITQITICFELHLGLRKKKPKKFVALVAIIGIFFNGFEMSNSSHLSCHFHLIFSSRLSQISYDMCLMRATINSRSLFESN